MAQAALNDGLDPVQYASNFGLNLNAENGYTGEQQQAVYSVVYAKKYPAVRDAALKLDPKPRKERTQPRPQVKREPTVIPFDPTAVFGCVVAVAMVVCVLWQ